jgi:phosphinothricin acetyltransferase
MTGFVVRDAREADVAAITGLYNALIPTETITWTEALETCEHRASWLLRQQSEGLPVLVAERAGVVAGFTTYEYFRGEGKWPGYRRTMELSIHVGGEHWGSGIGRALIEALIARGQEAGVHVLVAAIDSTNEGSLRFHERLGFVEVARMPQVGMKFGRWLDLVLMQRLLDSAAAPEPD